MTAYEYSLAGLTRHLLSKAKKDKEITDLKSEIQKILGPTDSKLNLDEKSLRFRIIVAELEEATTNSRDEGIKRAFAYVADHSDKTWY